MEGLAAAALMKLIAASRSMRYVPSAPYLPPAPGRSVSNRYGNQRTLGVNLHTGTPCDVVWVNLVQDARCLLLAVDVFDASDKDAEPTG